ncbi:BnaA01g31430D [Brassica napus]|uniref:BnaA01g31430D protein n=1 Tax=Brassica napus TaxID=3708 RepID=A0A078HD03_BRANA|nr:BnaA01g31430D [Brassica napus]
MVISPLLVIALVCLAGGGSHLPAVEAIWLTIPRAGDRCVYEEIQANVVVVGDFLCIDQNNEVGLGPTVNIRVTSAYGKEVYKRTNVTQGRFAFTTSESGTYLACLSMHKDQTHYAVDNSTAIVSLDWKMGIGTKDWDAIAKKEKIEASFKEASMREINEKTNKRVVQLSFMSVGLSVVVSLFQVWHLKGFFLKKKLI